jgi:hypothetical protein
LKYLLEQKIHTTLQHRGLSKLLGFDYTNQYKKGIKNIIIEALSRKEGHSGQLFHLNATLHSFSKLIPQWVANIKSSYVGDP